MSTEQPVIEAPEAEPEITDWKAEAERWKTIADSTDKRAKRFQDESKANAAKAKELEEIKQQSMTEIERAVAAAEAEGEMKATRKMGARFVESEFRVALAGRPVNVQELLDGLNTDRFLDSDGNPDVPKITKFADANWPVGEESPPKPRVPTGVRDPGKPAGADRHAAFAKFIDDTRR